MAELPTEREHGASEGARPTGDLLRAAAIRGDVQMDGRDAGELLMPNSVVGISTPQTGKRGWQAGPPAAHGPQAGVRELSGPA
jgi:hypothetical protein